MRTQSFCVSSRAFGVAAASLALVLSTLAPFAAGNCAVAQTAAVVTQAAPKALFISIIEGEGDLNDVRARTAREPIVQVEDENHRPVAGALILFSIDTNGTKQLANFSGSRTYSTRTGPDGRATARGYQIAAQAGPIKILVHAVVAGVAADAIINQTNFAKGSRLTRTVSQNRAWLGAAAGAAAIVSVVVLETQGSGTTITAGTGTVRP